LSILITGGSGFLGTNLVKGLKGEKIILYDLSSPKDEEILKRRDVEYVKGDILDLAKIFEIVKKYEVKGIIHTAALANYKFINENPYISFKINVEGTLNLLEVSRQRDIKLLYTSSGSVYGKISEGAKENNPLNPQDMYGMTKACSELLGLQYSNTYGLDFVSVRLYFLFGKGMSVSLKGVFDPPIVPQNVLFLFLFKALKREKLKIERGGESKIDFTYIKDAVHGIILAYYKKGRSKVYNISTGKAYSLKDIADIINNYVGDKILEIGDGELVGWPPRAPFLDISKAKEELGYEPIYGLEKGIKEFYEELKLNSC